jgi:hypothetical protein
MRMAALAGSLTLAMSVAAMPVAAQDDPSATIQEFMNALVAKDFGSLPGYFCAEQADQAAQFDMSALAEGMPPGVDAQALLDAFIFDVQLDTLETISQDDAEAVVRMAGTLTLDVDTEALVPVVTDIIEMTGMEADEATVEMFMSIVASEFESMSETVDGEVTLVAGEERPWLICDDLDFGSSVDSSADPSAEASMAPSDEAGDVTE